MQEMLSDMMFNLQPVADVYSSDDKNEEIAIACIEALARVPQQVNKWGHKTTLFLWRNLYKFYYYKLIQDALKIMKECLVRFLRLTQIKCASIIGKKN